MIHNISPQIDKNATFLSKVYRNFINSPHCSQLHEGDFETYDALLEQFAEHGLYHVVNEIKYRVTGGENLNNVFINVIQTHEDLPLSITNYLTTLFDIENRNWIEFFL